MDQPIPDQWQHSQRPATLHRRFEFDSYAQTRCFLDLLAAESERTGRYPDLSFGPRHVHVTLSLDGDADDRAAACAYARHASDCTRRVREQAQPVVTS